MIHKNTPYSEKHKKDYSIIKKSQLFDEDWYLNTYQDVAQSDIDPLLHFVVFGITEGRNPSPNFNTNEYIEHNKIKEEQNPLVHFITHNKQKTQSYEFNSGLLKQFSYDSLKTGIERLKNFTFFDEDVYIGNNQDVKSNKNLDPVNHAFCFGFSEGRSVLGKALISKELGRLAQESEPLNYSKTIKLDKNKSLLSKKTIGVFYNTEGNVFIKEIAEDLVAQFKSINLDAVLLDENSDPEERPEICLFVAPHEFFHLGEGQAWVRDDIISQSFVYNTEQPQTLWFERGLPFILLSKGVIDICSQMAQAFGEILPTCFLNPKIFPVKEVLYESDYDHPLIKILPQQAKQPGKATSDLSERSIDISFFGGTSRHREIFFSRHARFLSNYKNFIYYRRFTGPLTSSWRDEALGRVANHVAYHSKITLNIHRDDYSFFEWHRIAKQAMAGGSLVVSEPCLPHPVFQENIHYFAEEGRHMPDLIDWLLKDPDGQKKALEVRNNALSVVHNKNIENFFYNELITFLTKN